MASRIFDPDNFIFRPLGKLTDILALSLLWTVTSLPLVTLGAASTALYDSVVRCVLNGESGPYRRYVDTFKANLKVGGLTGIILLAVSLPLVWLFRMYMSIAGSGLLPDVLFGAFCLVALFLIGAMSYCFPVLSRFTFNVGGLLGVSLRLAVMHLPTTLLLGVISLVSIFACVKLIAPAVLLPAVAALVASRLLERIFKPLMDQQSGK